MNKRNYLVIKLFLVLFTISVSVAVLPCEIINVHGLFGEEITSTVVDDKEQEVVNIKSINHKKIQTAKGENIFNLWFEFLITIIYISFCADLVKLPRKDTIVTLKVRMDN
jgi:hypothetical protein